MIVPTPKTLISGGTVHINNTSITVIFDDIRYSLSTGPLHGGFHHTLGVRNQKLTFRIETEKDFPGGSAAAFMGEEMLLMGVPVNFSTGVMTAAKMEWHIYSRLEVDDTIIEVIVTAGFDKTAHEAGSGYFYKEKDGHFHCGTINLLVFTNKALTDGAMAKALITITEAKTAALIDCGIKDIHTGKQATGTATDGIILTIDPSGEILTDTGTFSLFGDTLAAAVREALTTCINTYGDQ